MSAFDHPIHDWLRKVHLCYLPGPLDGLLERFARRLLEAFRQHGHILQSTPDDRTDLILTTAAWGQPVRWRDALMFTARARYHLAKNPTVFTLLHARPADFRAVLNHFAAVLPKSPPDPGDYVFAGLAPSAYRTLFEQGRRGGPILALVRLLQAQAMCIRLALLIGEDEPEEAYLFELVGAHPRLDAGQGDFFYTDMMLRMVTAVSTQPVTQHHVIGEPIPAALWRSLETPPAMVSAGRSLGERNFFTQMVRIADLVHVPALADAIASQYSEGCFATWEPALGALIATVTGSARPVDKDRIGDDDLAVIAGVRPDGRGALVRTVEGKRNDPPSSEAVEMMGMDAALPWVALQKAEGWSVEAWVPVARSKLHGHRGVQAFDPLRVEYVPIADAYQHYPVSCSTDAQARAVQEAFARSETLQRPADPRSLAFTILPGHGVVIVEKWIAGKQPFQAIIEALDEGGLKISNLIPQGPLAFIPDQSGMWRVQFGKTPLSSTGSCDKID